MILIYWAVIDVSYPRKLSCEVGILRNTREEMSIPENFIECQHARRDLDELYKDSRNLATLLLIRRTKGIESAQRVVAQMAQNLGVLCSKGIRCVVARLLCLSRCGWGHAHNAAGVVRQPLRLLSGQREGLVH